MKRFLSFAIMALLLMTAVLAAGCSAAPASEVAEPSVSQEAPPDSEAADFVRPGQTCSPEDALSEEPESGWTVAINSKITHPTNITGFLNEEFGITVGFSGEMHYTADAGQAWPQGENSSMCRFCLDIVDENIAWAGGNGDMVRVTHDGGKSWEAVTDIAMGSAHSNIDFVDDQTGWIATLYKLEATKDGGTTWTEMTLPEGADGIAAISLRTPQDGYLLSRAGVLYTTADGGATWSEQDLGIKDYGIIDVQKQPKLGKNNLAVADISFTDQKNGTVVFTGMSSEGGFTTVCLTTADGGATWNEEALPDLEFSPVKVFLSGDGKYLTVASANNQTALLTK